MNAIWKWIKGFYLSRARMILETDYRDLTNCAHSGKLDYDTEQHLFAARREIRAEIDVIKLQEAGL